MHADRRAFLKKSALTSLGLSGALFPAFPFEDMAENIEIPMTTPNMIGSYGAWAANLQKGIPAYSFRNDSWDSLGEWKIAGRKRLLDRMAMPALGPSPEVRTEEVLEFDSLHIEKLSWQLPYGGRTEGYFMRPSVYQDTLPAVLAFHDHGGNKYFGKEKISRLSNMLHPLLLEHQEQYYSGLAWANELAKRGYAVLIHDAFPFASRKVELEDVSEIIKRNINIDQPDSIAGIQAYNQWASDHEHIMAKSLFCAGTTWPGVFVAEDQMALNILEQRPEVDKDRLACGGLSGGGMRTAFLAGIDERIKTAVCVGFMSTWRDFMLNKSYTHTWMVYVPLLPAEMDFPDIISLRAPLATLILNDTEDQLYTIEEMKRADEMIKEVYTKAGAAQNYRCSYYPGLHKFDKEMQKEAFEWFDQWLKNG